MCHPKTPIVKNCLRKSKKLRFLELESVHMQFAVCIPPDFISWHIDLLSALISIDILRSLFTRKTNYYELLHYSLGGPVKWGFMALLPYKNN